VQVDRPSQACGRFMGKPASCGDGATSSWPNNGSEMMGFVHWRDQNIKIADCLRGVRVVPTEDIHRWIPTAPKADILSAS
jgi:hypothetical protein